MLYVERSHRYPSATAFIHLVNNYWILLDMLHNFRFFSTKCPVLHNVIFLVHKILTFYINGAQRFICPNSSPNGQPNVWTDWVQVKVSWASWTPALRFESGTSLLENMYANCYTATLGTSVRSRRSSRWISNWYRLHFILPFNPSRAWVFGENMLYFYAFLVNYKFSLSCTANCYVKLSKRYNRFH